MYQKHMHQKHMHQKQSSHRQNGARRRLLVIAVGGLLSIILLLAVLQNSAQVNAANAIVSNVSVTSDALAHAIALNYQARLLDPATGQPKADGTYSLSFRLYDVETGGTALWTETKDVTATNGLVSTLLGDVTPFNPDDFSGQELWLAVKVGADAEATPRQRIAHVGYAVFAENSDTVDGMEAADFAPSVHTHDDLAPAVHTHDDLYYGKSTADSRYLNSAGPDTMSGNSTEPILTVAQEGNGSASLFKSTTGHGVVGQTASTSSGIAGVAGTAGDSGLTVPGKHGVLGKSDSGRGVVGSSQESDGTFGISSTGNGVRGDTIEGPAGVYGLGAGANSDGVRGITNSSSIGVAGVHGMAGDAATTINSRSGVLGESTTGRGVIGVSDSNDGVFGWSTSDAGLTGQSQNSYGVDALSVNSHGIFANGAEYGLYTPDKVFAGAGYNDIAEHMPAADDVEAADVVVIDPENDERVIKSYKANDPTVAGIIATDPALLIGQADTKTPLTLAGRVPVKASAENGPIARGDLLTTSDTPGHAMKAIPVMINGIPFYIPGTVIGKAMGELSEGTGVVIVLVMPQ